MSVAHAGRNVPMGRGTTDGVKKSVKRIRDAPNLHYRFYPEYARAPLASLFLSLCIFISVNPEDPSFFSFFFFHQPLSFSVGKPGLETASMENEKASS